MLFIILLLFFLQKKEADFALLTCDVFYFAKQFLETTCKYSGYITATVVGLGSRYTAQAVIDTFYSQHSQKGKYYGFFVVDNLFGGYHHLGMWAVV